MLPAALLLGVSGAIGVVLVTPLKYAATSQVFIASQGNGSVSDLTSGGQYAQAAAKNYASLVTSPYVLQPVARLMQSDEGALAAGLSVSVPINTSIISIAATASTPIAAARLANLTSTSLADAIVQLTPSGGTGSSVKVTQIAPAAVPLIPASPRIGPMILIGAVAGLLLGAIILTLRHVLDVKIRSEADAIAVRDVIVLGRVPRIPQSIPGGVIAFANPNLPEVERYRQLRSNLRFSTAARDVKQIVVVSAGSGEGKTTTATNLAVAMAVAGRRTLLIDADLRRPRVASSFGLDGAVGLTGVLTGEVSLDQAVQSLGELRLSVLPTGAIPPNPAELLQTQRMRDVLQQTRDQYDYVIVDSAPLLAVADAASLVSEVDGVLIVCGVGIVSRAHFARAVDGLGALGAHLLGITLNFVTRSSERSSYGYSYGVNS